MNKISSFLNKITPDQGRKFIGWLKIHPNEKFAVMKKSGKIDILTGPGRFFLYNSSYSRLTQFVINKNQYLRVKYLDGKEEHIKGPVNFYEDPTLHHEVKTLNACTVQPGETLLTYIDVDGELKPNYIHGYAEHLPKVGEILYQTLKRFSAPNDSYLSIKYKNGETKYIKGPASILENPMEFESITVNKLKFIPSQTGMIVYRQKKDSTDGGSSSIVVYGPCQYMPHETDASSVAIKLISATPNQYIEVVSQDGKTEYFSGPYEIWENPLKYKSLVVHNSLEVGTNEAIVVYHENNNQIIRNIHYGPILYHPKHGKEWIHTFIWHGADPNNPRKKIPCSLKFQKLRMVPDQMYLDIDNARTLDDAPLTINLMLFFELKNPDQMMDKTHDPIAAFMYSASADIMEFVGKYKFEDFKQNINELNDLKNYSQLVSKAENIGFSMQKVVFRGYLSTSTLEQMHNNAIETRTKLVLERETEEKAQYLQDFKLQKDKIRQEEVLKIKTLENDHSIKINEALNNSQLDSKRKEQEQLLLATKENFEQELEKERKNKEVRLEFLRKKIELEVKSKKECLDLEVQRLSKLKEMNVDLSAYMVALAKGKPDNWIQVDNESSNGPTPHIHIDKKL